MFSVAYKGIWKFTIITIIKSCCLCPDVYYSNNYTALISDSPMMLTWIIKYINRSRNLDLIRGSLLNLCGTLIIGLFKDTKITAFGSDYPSRKAWELWWALISDLTWYPVH